MSHRLEGANARIYRLHGLDVKSEIPLAAQRSRRRDPDLVVRWGRERTIPLTPPAGQLIARLEDVDYTATRTSNGYTLRYHRYFDFRISADRRVVEVDVQRGSDGRLASVLVAGNLSAFLLNLAGECVLHASAIQHGERTFAVVGLPGMGKSTLAALLCASGALLVSDDVLRVRREDDSAICFRGAGPIRLRPSAERLARRFPASLREVTPDDRIGVHARMPRASRFVLDAILIPRLDRDALRLEIRQLSQRESLTELLRYARFIGWRDAQPERQQFVELGRILEVVAVIEARIPWSDPSDPELARPLLERLKRIARER